jgi:hypothetical protein
MTTNKAQKRAVRARMAKTGEQYTSARHYLLGLHRDTPEPLEEDEQPAPLPARVADPGMTDAAIQRGSGKTWDEWFLILDAWNAASKGHTEIARYVREDHAVDGWWAQNVTVGYERARGMRALHQRPDGYSGNVSRTFPVSVERLFGVMTEQPFEGVRLRTAQPHRSARFDVVERGSRVSATFTSRGPEKASVQLQQLGLPDAEAVDAARVSWRAYLDRVGEALRGS